MKKILYCICAGILCAVGAYAQAPNLFNYQAAVRNGSGGVLASTDVPVRFTIRDADPTGAVLYQETNTVTTNAQGIFNTAIGSGTVVAGSLSSLNWSAGKRFLEVEVDAGSGLVSIGTQQLLSVPYAQLTKNVQPSDGNGSGLSGSAASSLWWGFYEAGEYRGYLGSYAGKNEDVDFGTGGGNNVGSVHLTISAIPKLTVDSIGNVGVGTRFPQYRFQVNGVTGGFVDEGIRMQNTSSNTGWSFYPSSTGDMIIGTTSNRGQFNGTTGAYTSSSDERLKSDIRPLESILPRVLDLQVRRYSFKHSENSESIGVIAQDLRKSFPEYVSENTGDEGNPLVPNQLFVDYAGLSVLAIKAIQEQQVLIQQLMDKNKALEAAIEELKK